MFSPVCSLLIKRLLSTLVNHVIAKLSDQNTPNNDKTTHLRVKCMSKLGLDITVHRIVIARLFRGYHEEMTDI